MEYRDLLKKYMQHVLDEEGITFTSNLDPEEFTNEEIKVLEEIKNEL